MNQESELGSIIFGGMAITGLAWGGADLKESMAAIHTALDHGITTFDTAPSYGFGLSEELIGRAIAGQRNRVYIATKVGLRWDGVPGKLHMRETFRGKEYVVVRHAKADSIVWEVEQSLRRLGTDWIEWNKVSGKPSDQVKSKPRDKKRQCQTMKSTRLLQLGCMPRVFQHFQTRACNGCLHFFTMSHSTRTVVPPLND
ncbi:MAG: diketogulonate reductase-like aldo/keto reductase [Candidatus Latescibacterota bacterium]|jgi:diketogulonate reductase-like aldo/keto reductase